MYIPNYSLLIRGLYVTSYISTAMISIYIVSRVTGTAMRPISCYKSHWRDMNGCKLHTRQCVRDTKVTHQFRYIKNMYTCLRVLGKQGKKYNIYPFPGPQDDFFWFIAPSLGAASKQLAYFENIQIQPGLKGSLQLFNLLYY